MAGKRYYMACLDLEGRPCLVVGGGAVGLEKATGLLDSGATVTVVAPASSRSSSASPSVGAASATRRQTSRGNSSLLRRPRTER